MPRKKLKNKRQLSKYPALDKTYNLKTRTELNDFDYIDGFHDEETGMSIRPLNDKEKEWLNNFQAEYVNAEFQPKKKRVHKKLKKENPKNTNLKKLNKLIMEYVKIINQEIQKAEIGTNSQVNIKKTVTKFKKELQSKIKKEFKYIKDFYKKDAYDRNNARNRCILTKAKASGKITGFADLNEDTFVSENMEDKIIENLDLAKDFQSSEDE